MNGLPKNVQLSEIEVITNTKVGMTMRSINTMCTYEALVESSRLDDFRAKLKEAFEIIYLDAEVSLTIKH